MDQASSRLVFTSGSPESAALIAAKDWSRTPVGDPSSWPPALTNVLDMALANRFPMVLWWGSQLVQFYNDPYRPILGEKHPNSMGQTAYECWSEIWDVIGPQLEQVYSGRGSTWNEDLPLDMNRYGFVEETYFTFSYSPLPDPGAPHGIGGVLATVYETTEKVIGTRRIALLRELAERSSEVRSVEDECSLAAEILERYPKSIPFSLIYVLSEDRKSARLAASSGLSPDLNGAPHDIEPFVSDKVEIVHPLDAFFDRVPPGPWPEQPHSAAIVPIEAAGDQRQAGFLVVGLNPRIRLDDDYRTFLQLVAGQIANAIAQARAYEEERKRAEALAEIDRAKTAFFSNVSHEFRTPLTLMLGPLDELTQVEDERTRALAETARRNSLRLLKLVNALLEFSRLEAGRNDAAFAKTDLAAFTRDVASSFRSAIESTGLRLRVNADLDEPVFVDRSMWERVLLNLLSNALKFTFEGEIAVILERAGGFAELRVEDTGTGIPAEELPHVFERFHRVRGANSRTHEGSGIGLALVRDLIALHGGSIDVQSRPGEGTAFTVRVPLGAAHLDQAKVVKDEAASYTSAVEQYLAELDATIGGDETSHPSLPVSGGARARVLLADDNGDLRAYVSRILAPHCEVVAVSNGAEALRALRSSRFDLIVTDVMMPEMGGFELLAAVRADAGIASTPVIVLSARAGEESAIEGLTRGADDYIVKPFSAEELLARVYARINAAALRERALEDLRSSEERFRTLTSSLPYIVYEADATGAVTFLSDEYAAYTGRSAESGLGEGWISVLHPDDLQGIAEGMLRVLSTGKPFSIEARMRRYDGVYRWHLARALVQRGADGEIMRWVGTIVDIHDARRAAEERELFAEAGRVLAQTLDLRATLKELAQLTVPQFADWCRIDLRIDGANETVAVGSERRLGDSSYVTVPLLAEEETIGSLTVGYAESNRRYLEDDVPMLEELGRRAGLAIHKARLFEREHRVAESFQEASLPLALPNVPGLSFDAIYAPGNTEAHVGGDWYDAVRLPDGRVVVSIGDVAGSGLEAAVTMGNMRQIIRGIAQVHADPALMLDAADRALRLEQPEKFVTAFVGVIDPIGKTLTYASSGHPPAMLRMRDGSIKILSDEGLPLGLRANGSGSLSRTVAIDDGCCLVLYTDGLTEFARNPESGERILEELLRDDDVCSSRNPAATIVARMLKGVAPHDDIAVLTVNFETASLRNFLQRWNFDSSRADVASAARREFAAACSEHGGEYEDVATAELVFGELVGNAVRYAPGEVEVIADWSGAEPVLHVCDTGPGFRHIAILPPDLLSESGRGLFIVSSLTHDFHVSKRPEGGSHARAVLSWQRHKLARGDGINTSGSLLFALTDPAAIVSVSP